MAVQGFFQSCCRVGPNLVRTYKLLWIFRRQVEGEVVEPEGSQNGQYEIQHGCDLVSKLFWCYEEVAVILSKTADSHESVQGSGSFVAVHGAEFKQPKGKFFVTALAMSENQTMHRTVHWLRVVRPIVHFHWRVHTVCIKIQMTRSLKELFVRKVGSVNKFVTAIFVTLAAVILH